MPTIEYEGKTHVFPDDFSQADIASALANQPAQPGLGEDFLKSGGIGVVKGGIGLAGLPADLGELGAKGIDKATQYAGKLMGLDLQRPGTQQTISQGVTGEQPTRKTLTSFTLPGAADIRSGVEKVTGPLYEPKTTAGEYAQTAGEFLPAIIGGPETLLAKLATRVAVPAVTSETAGQLTKGTAAEPYARLIGGVGGSVAASKAAGALERSSVRAQAPAQDAVMQEAQDAYKEIKDLSNTRSGAVSPATVTMTPRSTDQLAENIGRALKAEGFRDVTAGKTLTLADELRAPLQAGKTEVTAADVLAVRTALGKVRMGADPVERAAAATAIDKIDTYLSNLRNPRGAVSGPGHLVADAADRAIDNYAVAKRSGRITDAVNKAELQAASSGIGGNLDNALRQQIKAILNNPKKAAGYSADELAAMRKVVGGTTMGNLARAVSRLGPSHLLSGGLAAAGAYGATGDPWAAVGAMAAGAAGQKYATASRKSQIANLDALVRSRSSLSPVSPQQMAVALRNPVGLRQTLISALLSSPQMRQTQPQQPGTLGVDQLQYKR